MVGYMAHTSRTQSLCQPFHTTQMVFSISLDHVVSGEGHSYLTAMSPSRAQHVLWICDVALCTYVRCSHDSKFSPHPPSVICLESRNWQAWATSLHATLQRQRIRQGWVHRRACICFPDANGSCASPCPWQVLSKELKAQKESALIISQAPDLGGVVSRAGELMSSQGVHPNPPFDPNPTPETTAEELPDPYSPITVCVLHTGKCLQTKPGAIREANSPAPGREGRPVLSRVLGQKQVVTPLYPQQE